MKDAEVIPLNTVAERITGKIFYINKEKGFAFINSPKKKFTRIFGHWQQFHHSIDFEKLELNTIVEFELEHDQENGYRAVRIRLA